MRLLSSIGLIMDDDSYFSFFFSPTISLPLYITLTLPTISRILRQMGVKHFRTGI